MGWERVDPSTFGVASNGTSASSLGLCLCFCLCHCHCHCCYHCRSTRAPLAGSRGLTRVQNEIVLDTLGSHFGRVGGRAPPAVAAFFMTGQGDEAVRKAHSDFLKAHRGTRVPLLRLSLHAPKPFSLA